MTVNSEEKKTSSKRVSSRDLQSMDLGCECLRSRVAALRRAVSAQREALVRVFASCDAVLGWILLVRVAHTREMNSVVPQ